ncbi:TPA: Fe2+/Pb2+ permease [Mannheimia haemolytica]|nr:Fe2+/Pb2+ permease [Mannheimia haemolytica]
MKLKTLVLIPLLFSSTVLLAKVNVSPLFVQLSDAMAESKKGEFAKSSENLTALQHNFQQISQHNSPVGNEVQTALKKAIESPSAEHLENLAKKLYAFEKEQNPSGYAEKHQDFVAKMTPLYTELAQTVPTQEIAKIKWAAYQFGKNWVKQEKAVREISLTHYGKFERILGLMRINLNAEKPDIEKISKLVSELGVVMAEFKQVKVK